MALVAVETDSQEKMGGIFHGFLGLAQNLEVGGGRIFLVGSLGR